MTTQDSLGTILRSERERRGITLEAVARSTKFRPALLAALERGEVSKLPGGIFRRALIRSYASAIGLPPELLLTAFSLHAEPAGTDLESAPDEPASGGMRLTLELEPESFWQSRSARRMLAAIADTGAILLLAAVAAQFSETNYWVISGAIGLMYYALSTALLGRSPASWSLTRAMFSLERLGLLQGRTSLAPSGHVSVQSHPARL